MGLWSAIAWLGLAELGFNFELVCAAWVFSFQHPGWRSTPYLGCVVLMMEGRSIRKGNYVMFLKVSTVNWHNVHCYLCSISQSKSFGQAQRQWGRKVIAPKSKPCPKRERTIESSTGSWKKIYGLWDKGLYGSLNYLKLESTQAVHDTSCLQNYRSFIKKNKQTKNRDPGKTTELFRVDIGCYGTWCHPL